MCNAIRKFITTTLATALLTAPMLAAADKQTHHHHHQQTSDSTLPEPTAAELQAAFPDLGGMDLRQHMDTPLLAYVLLDQLEIGRVDGQNLFAWDAQGWIGYDLNRFWWRTEGEQLGKETEAAEVTLLYGRALSRWWDVVIGARHVFEPTNTNNHGQTFLALGFQGLAPQWFETELTLYLTDHSQARLRAEFEYEILFTQQLTLVSSVEINLSNRDDLERGVGAGLMNTELGTRLHYGITREFAPYIGANWTRKYGNTANLADESTETVALVGFRWWY